MSLRTTLLVALVLPSGCASAGVSPDSVAPAARERKPSATPERLTPEAVPTDVVANVPVLPWGITSFGAVEHGGVLYVLGGYTGVPHAYSRADQHGELLAYDPATQQWSIVARVPPVQGAALVSHRSGLIRVGGMRALNATPLQPSELVSSDTVQRFDPSAGTWEALPSLPQGRSSFDAVVVEDRVYVVGGWTLAGDAKKATWPDDMLVLDLAAPDSGWTSVPAPLQRRALAVATTGSKIIAFGGMEPSRDISTQVDVFDVNSGQWSRADPFPGQGFGMAAVGTAQGVIASGSDGAVHRLEPATGVWTTVSSLAQPRFFHRLVAAADGAVWALGGIRPDASGVRMRMAEAVLGGPAVPQLELRSPLASKNRQGSVIVGDALHLVGGNNSLGQHDFAPKNFTVAGTRLDLGTLSWTPMADYPVPRQSMSVALHEGEVVAFGGFGPGETETARSHPEAFAYSPEDDVWAPRPGLGTPGGRTQFGLARSEGSWWAFGGLDYDPTRPASDQFRHETSILRTPAAGQPFEPSGAELREPRRAFAGARWDDRYVVVGGMREGFQLVDSCEAFVFASQSWESFPCPNTVRLSGHLVAVGEHLALVGGSAKGAEGKLEPQRTIEVFDRKEGAWRTLEHQIPFGAKHIHVFGWRGRVLVVSLHNEDSAAHLAIISVEDSAAG